uniref:Uncharacterized protein n=1 Tax=Rhizophora mucronata TaxID=61149 RepID=A0A2P2R2B9_RHIMU
MARYRRMPRLALASTSNC